MALKRDRALAVAEERRIQKRDAEVRKLHARRVEWDKRLEPYQRAEAPLDSLMRDGGYRSEKRLIAPQTKEARMRSKRRRQQDKVSAARESQLLAEDQAQLAAFDRARAKSRHAKKRGGGKGSSTRSLPALHDPDSSDSDDEHSQPRMARGSASTSLPRIHGY